MQQDIFFIVQDSLDGGYEAQALHYSIFTQAETYEDLKSAIRDAVSCHFDEAQIPAVVHLHYVKDGVMAV